MTDHDTFKLPHSHKDEALYRVAFCVACYRRFRATGGQPRRFQMSNRKVKCDVDGCNSLVKYKERRFSRDTGGQL